MAAPTNTRVFGEVLESFKSPLKRTCTSDTCGCVLDPLIEITTKETDGKRLTAAWNKDGVKGGWEEKW